MPVIINAIDFIIIQVTAHQIGSLLNAPVQKPNFSKHHTLKNVALLE